MEQREAPGVTLTQVSAAVFDWVAMDRGENAGKHCCPVVNVADCELLFYLVRLWAVVERFLAMHTLQVKQEVI